MTIFHQSINGDREGAYALLGTSMEDVLEAKRIYTATDLRARPADGISWSPAIRGFAHDKYYLFLKTFKDESANVRAGRTFSHALIVEKGALSQINDLEKVLALLPDRVDRTLPLQRLELNVTKRTASSPIPKKSRQAKAINALLRIEEFRNTIVWVGQEGFTELVTAIWGVVAPAIREKLHFDVAFHPNDVDTSKINIVWIPAATAVNWMRSGFCIIQPTDEDSLNGPAALFLSGDLVQGAAIADVMERFQIVPAEPVDYAHIERISQIVEPAAQKTDLRTYLVTADIISRLSPDATKGSHQKQLILQQICTSLLNATATEIVGLTNINWRGFDNAQSKIAPALEQWLSVHLQISQHADTTKVVTKALEPSPTWWHKIVVAAVEQFLKAWKAPFAVAVWQWWQNNPALVPSVMKLLPVTLDVEKDLTNSFPVKISKELAKELLPFTKDRQWMILYGLLLMQLHPAQEAIEKLLLIDNVPESMEPIRVMTQRLPDTDVINVALQQQHSKLIILAGERISLHPALLNDMDVNKPTWQKIWFGSLQSGSDPWNGIANPSAVMASLLDRLLNGQSVDSDLLLRLSRTPFADLTEYQSRARIWNYLPATAKANYLRLTARQVVRKIDQNALGFSGIESEIIAQIQESDFAEAIILDSQLQGSFKLQLFDRFPALRRNTQLFNIFLNRYQLTQSEAMLAGRIIANHKWKEAAWVVAERISNHPVLKAALQECEPLFNVFERWRLHMNGSLNGARVSKDEWWRDFQEVSKAIYQRGPSERGIWSQAGGNDFDLQVIGSGQEIWANALVRLRQGAFKDITTIGLLDKMIEENGYNKELPILKELYKKL